MKSTSLVSCVIPSYRGEKYLGDAIESFLKQDYPNKEIIVVIESFPGDNSYVLYKEKYSHISFVRIYIFHEKMTPAKARNLGIELAQGEYICVLDDDDYLLGDGHLGSGIRFLETHHTYGFVSFSSKMLFSDKFFQYRGTDPHHKLDKFNFTHSGTIFKRDVLVYVKCYNPSFRFYEDLDLFLRLSQVTKIYVLPQLVIKRFNDQSITNRYSAFYEFYFWFQVVFNFRSKYPGFYFGFFKKMIKCFLPKRLEMYLFRFLVKFHSQSLSKC